MTGTNKDQNDGPKSEAKATRILLVRHGVTGTTGKVLPGRAEGLNLSADGHDQAQQLAARISDVGQVTAVYSSPLERTLQTAAPIAGALDLGIAVNEGLLECDFGQWTGASLPDLAKKPEWKLVQNNPSAFRFPDGESFLEMQMRIVATLVDIANQHPGEMVVAVSHADPIKAAVSFAAGAHLDQFQRFVISPCSVSVLLVTDGIFHVLSVNSTGHNLGSLALS